MSTAESRAATAQWMESFRVEVSARCPLHRIDWPTARVLHAAGNLAREAAETYCAPLVNPTRVQSLITELEIDSRRLA